MNYLQLSLCGKPVNLFFSSDLREMHATKDGQPLKLSADDKLAIINVIEQELYLSLQDYQVKGGKADA